MKNHSFFSESRSLFQFQLPENLGNSTGNPEQLENERGFKYEIKVDSKTKAAMLKTGYDIEDEDSIRLGDKRLHFDNKTEAITFELDGRNNEILCKIKDKGAIIEQIVRLSIDSTHDSTTLGRLIRVSNDPDGSFRNLPINKQLWELLIEADINHGVSLHADAKSGVLAIDQYIKGRKKAVDTITVFAGITTDDVLPWRRTLADALNKIMYPEKEREEEAMPEQRETQEQLKSRANAPHTIADAIVASEQFLGTNRNWEFPPKGKLFENALSSLKAQLPKLADVLESKAQQGGVDEVNRFLKEKGFDIQLEDMGGPFDVYTASVLDMNVRWKNPGKAIKMKLESDEKEIDAVSMKELQSVFESAEHNHPIIQVETSADETVCMTRFEGTVPQDSTSLFRLVYKLSRSKQPATGYKGARFPMVDFNDSGDIEELIGARTTGKDGSPAEIAQALYQHRLRMNEVGARAQATAALGMSRGISMEQPVVIDGPFLIWFEKDGVIPFSAHITEKHMKKPENLD